MSRTAVRILSVLLGAVLLASGCASSPRRDGPKSAFIHPAPKDSTSPAPYDAGAPADSLETTIGKIRELSARAHPVAKRVPGVTIESLDPQLSAALLAVRTWPSAGSHRRAAEEYLRVRILDAAFDHYRAALRLDEQDGASFDGLARIWRDWRLPGLALGDARRAVYHAGDSAEAHNTLGTVLQALGNRSEAQRAYHRSLELRPGAAYALNNLGYVSLLDGDGSAAVEYFRRAVTADPTLQAARHNLALAYAASGHLDLATTELRAADAPAQAAYNLGIINLARRDRAGALAAFDIACHAAVRIAWACERYAALQASHTPTEGTP